MCLYSHSIQGQSLQLSRAAPLLLLLGSGLCLPPARRHGRYERQKFKAIKKFTQARKNKMQNRQNRASPGDLHVIVDTPSSHKLGMRPYLRHNPITAITRYICIGPIRLLAMRA